MWGILTAVVTFGAVLILAASQFDFIGLPVMVFALFASVVSFVLVTRGGSGSSGSTAP